jgi:hypothetical protein
MCTCKDDQARAQALLSHAVLSAIACHRLGQLLRVEKITAGVELARQQTLRAVCYAGCFEAQMAEDVAMHVVPTIDTMYNNMYVQELVCFGFSCVDLTHV